MADFLKILGILVIHLGLLLRESTLDSMGRALWKKYITNLLVMNDY